MGNFERNANGKFQKEASFYTIFHGKKSILLEDELNELQWVQIERLATMARGQYTNGVMNNFDIKTTNYDDIFYLDSNSQFSVLMDGYDLRIGHNIVANQPTDLESKDNRVVIKLSHDNSGYDFVFLEAWFEVMRAGETIKKFGGTDTPSIPFEMKDGRLGKETSRRIQFRWRIRSVKNKSNLNEIFAQNYDGQDTSIKYEFEDNVYTANVGVQRYKDENDKNTYEDVKTLGRIYAIPLFKVNRNNSYIIKRNQIEDLVPRSVLRLLGEYDISKIAHAVDYVKLLKVSSIGLSSTIGDRGVWIDGKLVHYAERSYGLVVIRKMDGSIVFTESYDIYGSDSVNDPDRKENGIRNANLLASKLAEYDNEYIVIIYTYDEPQENRLQPALVEQIKRCGGGALFESSEFEYRSAYILIGSPGIGENKGIELYEGEEYEDENAFVSLTTFLVDGEVLSGGGSRTGGVAVNKRMSLASMSDVETTAEILRGMGGSGVYSTRQYGIESPFEEQSKVFSVSYNTIGEHNHPNFRGMPGLPELAIVINGYYMRTRHNDYRTFVPTYKYNDESKKGDYLYREEVFPPKVPDNIKNAPLATQYDYMKNVHTNNPQDCEWHLAYMEVWWEKFDPTLTDYSDSFRHQINNSDAFELFADHIYWSISGLKNRGENVAFFPISALDFDESGKPIYLNLRYRINTMVVGTLEDIPFNREKAIEGIIDNTNRFTLMRDLQTKKRYKYTGWDKLIDSGRARFKCADLIKLMEKCPGIDGIGAPPIYESANRNDEEYDVYKSDGSAPLNSCYYNHSYSTKVRDASGRVNGERSFNDPNLFVAKTVWDEAVYHGYSYALPLELILRTPRESWNPYDVKLNDYSVMVAENNDGKGKSIDKPYSGYHYEAYNFTIPADMYDAIDISVSDVADTANNAFILDKNGVSRKFMASGIKIYDYDSVRMRFPIYSEFHDFTKGAVEVSLLKDQIKDALMKIYKGTITENEIENLF